MPILELSRRCRTLSEAFLWVGGQLRRQRWSGSPNHVARYLGSLDSWTLKRAWRRKSQPIQPGLVLCNSDVCRRKQVQLETTVHGFQARPAEGRTSAVPPHIDLPLGVQESWPDDQLRKHSFIVLLSTAGSGDRTVAPN